MIVYSNQLVLKPQKGLIDIAEQIVKWVGPNTIDALAAEKILHGVDRSLRPKITRHAKDTKENQRLISRATVDAEDKPLYPYLFSVQYGHDDPYNPGRRWITEIGLKQETPDSLVCCSFLLRTDEISARAARSVGQVTRPRIVSMLAEKCQAVSGTPGLRAKKVDADGAKLFLEEIESAGRKHPILLISSSANGAPIVPADKLRGQLIGIADVVEITHDTDSYALEKILGKRYSAWNGAVNVIFPPRQQDLKAPCKSTLIMADKVNAAAILDVITHATNITFSWQHITPDMVSQRLLRHQLDMLKQHPARDDAGKLEEYELMIEIMQNDIKTHLGTIEGLHASIDGLFNEVIEHEGKNERLSGDVEKLQNDCDSLKALLNNKPQATPSHDLEQMRDLVAGASVESVALYNILKLLEALYPDRLSVLETAYASAKESHDFQDSAKARELLFRFATKYWEALAHGKAGDSEAKKVFSDKVYAQTEGSALTAAGERRRTFKYKNVARLMMKHLKVGNGESTSNGLRIHFDWIGEEKRLVIGYCGRHLDR